MLRSRKEPGCRVGGPRRTGGRHFRPPGHGQHGGDGVSTGSRAFQALKVSFRKPLGLRQKGRVPGWL